MIRLSALSVALLLLPCVAPAQEPDDSVAQQWQQAVARLPADPSAAAEAVSRAYARSGIPLMFWVSDSLSESQLSGLTVHMHPCGSVALMPTRRIPPSDGRLQAERIVEIDSTGRELRRWLVPVDVWPLALNGQELVVNLHAGFRGDLALGISLAGDYRVLPFTGNRVPQVIECPPYRGFGESAYVRCATLAGRTLAYEGPCT
jgi:hypothetical protein